MESLAVSHLMERVSPEMLLELKEASRCRGMRQWLTHDVIAKEMFNRGWSSGTGGFAAWSIESSNDAENILVAKFIERLKKDWDRLPSGMKKPWLFKDALQVHASCGGFIAIMAALEKSVPKGDFDAASATLSDQFNSGYLDPDITAFLEVSTPPIKLSDVNFVRNIVASVEQRKQADMHEKERELQEKVTAATVEQLRHKFNQDIETLKSRVQGREEVAMEAAKDARYLSQRKGQQHTKAFMEKNCKLVFVGDGKNAFPEIAKFLAAWGHMQLPISQQQTANTALLKHRTRLQHFLLESKLDPTNEITLIFDKSGLQSDGPGANSKDKRKATHPCHLVTADCHPSNSWMSSAVPEAGTIGPCPLIRCSDMLCYDPDCRPGPAARIEQKGVPAHSQILQSYLRGIEFGEKDVVVWVDVLANRYCEFGRAVLKRLLDGNSGRPRVIYFGCLRDEQADVQNALEEMVYTHWDQSDSAPPRSRPVEQAADPELVLLSWSSGQPCFPEAILTKYAEGTKGHKDIHAMNQELIALFPNARVQGAPTPRTGGRARATGRPDYSIDGGLKPVDHTRTLHKTMTPKNSFTVERKLYVAGVKGKPSLVLDVHYGLWIGNESEEEVTFAAGEIAGFNLGSFEEKVVAGLGERELSGLPFRFVNDLSLVSHDKKIMPLADYMHQICTVHGVADFELACHDVVQKQYPPESDGAEPVPVPYRYTLSPARNGKCQVYKPSAVTGDAVRL
ncbi:unnamed protein product [Durusdinium trenchii]|uniref:Uncharacterized protein n=1 Tax=Durusdinium trenchii TaxID=1381693 RepID=A0ABP0PGE1_9DINO